MINLLYLLLPFILTPIIGSTAVVLTTACQTKQWPRTFKELCRAYQLAFIGAMLEGTPFEGREQKFKNIWQAVNTVVDNIR